jgi:hypothetical protein
VLLLLLLLLLLHQLQLAALPEHLRPSTLGFGGLADGFLPFDIATAQQQQQQQAAEGAAGATGATAAVDDMTAALEAQHLSDAAAAGSTHNRSGSSGSIGSIDSMVCTSLDSSSSSSNKPVTLPICSLVMKAVQAHLDIGCSSSSSTHPAPADTHAGNSAAAAAAAGSSQQAGGDYPYAGSLPPAAADVCGSSSGSSNYSSCMSEQEEEWEEWPEEQQQQQQCRMRLGTLQESAVKLGDGSSLSKAQVDPRLPAETQKEVLSRVQAMVAEGLAQLRQGSGDDAKQQSASLSEVLREAYVAVVRQGLLNAA